MAYTNSSNKKYKCEIILIGKDINSDRTVDVHCHFSEYDKSLVPGLFMNATINVSKRDAFLVDEDAIVGFEGKTYLFSKIDKNLFRMHQVEILERNNGVVGIDKKNIEFVDKQIVKNGAYALLMAMKNSGEE